MICLGRDLPAIAALGSDTAAGAQLCQFSSTEHGERQPVVGSDCARSRQRALSLGWGLPLRVRGCRRLARWDLNFSRLCRFARALCNLRVEIPQFVALGLRRLAELSILPSIKAPFGGLRISARLGSFREDDGKRRDQGPHGRSSIAQMVMIA